MKTEQMAPRTLAYIRVTGPYGTGYEPVCDQLYQWSAEQGLAEGSGSLSTTTTPKSPPPSSAAPTSASPFRLAPRAAEM